MSADRAYRIWKKAGLQLPRRRPRRRVATGRPRPLPATRANRVWAYDFVFDACANGQQLKCLTVIDEFTRECLAIDVAGSIRSGRVIEVLSKLVSVRGAPKYLRSDNGPEFVSRAVLQWLQRRTLRPHGSIPGSPGRTDRTRASTGSFETSASECSGSKIESMRKSQSTAGVRCTTRFDRDRASTISHRQSTLGEVQRSRPSSRNRWSEETRQVRKPASRVIRAL